MSPIWKTTVEDYLLKALSIEIFMYPLQESIVHSNFLDVYHVPCANFNNRDQ